MRRDAEWLEADGLGGFASGTVGLIRTRRYHALLLAAATPPTGRVVLVNGLEAWVELGGEHIPLTTQRYAPDVLHPDGAERLSGFRAEPWPTWSWMVRPGVELFLEVVVPAGRPRTVLRWTLRGNAPGGRLCVRLLCSGRDYHGLHHENPDFRFEPVGRGNGWLRWQLYPGLPALTVTHGGAYQDAPEWYRNFHYAEEAARGLDHREDLASPGVIAFDLEAGPALLQLEATPEGDTGDPAPVEADAMHGVEAERQRRTAGGARLDRAADAYLVRRGAGRTIVAGYPWFTDWGRDTLIALRGLCLARDLLDDAGAILREWAGSVSQGMLPNRFPDAGTAPEYNSVDASLWFVVGVHEYLARSAARGRTVTPAERDHLISAVQAILEGHVAGTRYGIRADGDGLLAAGEPGVQLTWMDAKVGDWVVTPRIGKPVEVQALWINALAIGAEHDRQWGAWQRRAQATFAERFWNPGTGGLFDVVDVDHVPGTADASIRPNQVFAVGGLPVALLDGARARSVVDLVEQRLFTPMGLRTLDPADVRYVPRYEGGPLERDGAYHQGTAWPWLMGPFVEAWVQVRGSTEQARGEARERFLTPLLAQLDVAGIGHLAEIADGEPPHAARGCPFQAWSVAEAIRLDRDVLATASAVRTPVGR